MADVPLPEEDAFEGIPYVALLDDEELQRREEVARHRQVYDAWEKRVKYLVVFFLGVYLVSLSFVFLPAPLFSSSTSVELDLAFEASQETVYSAPVVRKRQVYSNNEDDDVTPWEDPTVSGQRLANWNDIDLFAEVVSSEKEFAEQLASSKNVFVAFKADWCVWSRKLRPIWHEFARQYKDDSPTNSVNIIEVDCSDKCKKLCQREHVLAFPTVRWYRDGKKLGDYSNSAPRTVEAYRKYLEQQMQSTETNDGTLALLEQNIEVRRQEKTPVFEGSGELPEEDIPVAESNAGDEYESVYDSSIDSGDLSLKQNEEPDEDPHVSGEAAIDDVRGDKSSFSDGPVELTSSNFDEYVTDTSSAFVVFYAPWCIWSQRMQPTWDKLAHLVASKSHDVVIGKVDCVKEEDFCRSHTVLEYPTIRWFRRGRAGSPDYKRDRSLEALYSHALSQLNRKDETTVVNHVDDPVEQDEYDSEANEDSGYEVLDQTDHVIHLHEESDEQEQGRGSAKSLMSQGPIDLTADDFDQYVKNSNFAFVHFYYAPSVWCQRMEPTWADFARLVASNNVELVVGKVDCVAESDLCRSHSIMAYPTLRWYTNGEAFGPDYKRDRQVEALYDFALSRMNLKGTKPIKHEVDTPVEQEDEEAVASYDDVLGELEDSSPPDEDSVAQDAFRGNKAEHEEHLILSAYVDSDAKDRHVSFLDWW